MLRIAVTFGLAVVLPAAPAQAAWSPATTLPTSAGAAAPVVAINARGDAAVAWTNDQTTRSRTTRVRVAVRRGPAGRFATATLLRQGDLAIGGLAVAIDRRGEATVAWVDRANTRGLLHGHIALRAAFRPRGGRWSAVRRITYTSPFRYAFPRLAAAPDGRVLLAFNAGVKAAPGVAAVWRRPGRPFGSIERLNTGPRGYFFDLQVNFDASGKAYLSGVRDCDTARSSGVLFTASPGASRFAASRLVAPAPVRDFHFVVTGRSEGELAWLGTACSTTEYHAGPVRAAALNAGRVGAPATIATDPAFGLWLTGGAAGGAEVAWTASPPGFPNGVIQISRADPAGIFGTPFAPADGLVAVAADSAGDQLVGPVQPSYAGSAGFPARVGIRLPGAAVDFAPIATSNVTGVGTASPGGRGIAIAVPGRAGIRLASWRP